MLQSESLSRANDGRFVVLGVLVLSVLLGTIDNPISSAALPAKSRELSSNHHRTAMGGGAHPLLCTGLLLPDARGLLPDRFDEIGVVDTRWDFLPVSSTRPTDSGGFCTWLC